MTTRQERLKKLVERAGAAEGAARDAPRRLSWPRRRPPRARPPNCVERFDAAGSLSALFPDVYHRRIGQALDRERRATGSWRAARGRPRRHGDRAHQHGRARLSRGQRGRTSAAGRPRAAGDDRPASLRGRGAARRQVRLPQAFPVHSLQRPKSGTGAAFLGDIPTERHRSRRCACRRAVRPRGGARQSWRAGTAALGRRRCRRFSRRRPQELGAGRQAARQTGDAGILQALRGDGAADLHPEHAAQGGRKRSTARAWPATCGSRCCRAARQRDGRARRHRHRRRLLKATTISRARPRSLCRRVSAGPEARTGSTRSQPVDRAGPGNAARG